MITDKFGNEIHYHDYVIYLRENEPILARVVRLVIDRSGKRLVCCISKDQYVTLKKLDNLELVSEEWANINYQKYYEKLKNCRK